MTTTTTAFFEVGGCVRDELLGLPTKDVDFAVVAPSFDAMRDALTAERFTIHTENPEFFTIRCGVPAGHRLRERCKDADFVWARVDGPSSDGRRPDWVRSGTLADDLARRDFTVNAMARDMAGSGEIIDPHGGREDLAHMTLRFVGDPVRRLQEDGLRVLRGLRFIVTKGFTLAPGHDDIFASHLAADMLAKVSTERIREELERMLAHDTPHTLRLLHSFPMLTRVMFDGGSLRLSATMKG